MKRRRGTKAVRAREAIKAVILAGGKGTRLAPYTAVFPKPLVPIGDRPILEIIIRQLRNAGINDVVLSVGHLGELIEAYFHNVNLLYPGLHLSYQRESKPLGTAGPLALIPGLGKNFLVMNGDVLTSLDYRDLIDFHLRMRAILTIAIHGREVRTDLGVLKTNSRGRLTSYEEKPVLKYNVSMGVYIYNIKVLDYIPKNRYLDFPDLVNRLLCDGEKVVGFHSHDYWLDIGRKEDYELAQQEFHSIEPPFQLF